VIYTWDKTDKGIGVGLSDSPRRSLVILQDSGDRLFWFINYHTRNCSNNYVDPKDRPISFNIWYMCYNLWCRPHISLASTYVDAGGSSSASTSKSKLMISWWSSTSELSSRPIIINMLTLILNSVNLGTFSVLQVSALMSNCFVVCQYLPNYQLCQCPLLIYQKMSMFHQDQQIKMTLQFHI
jgi:hypothetical protein